MTGRWVRFGGILAVAAASAAVAAPASASVTSVLGGATWSGTAIPCTPQADGVQVCHGSDESLTAGDLRFKSVIGSVSTPLELYVILPPGASANGRYPLIVQSHGWGSSAGGPNDTQYLGPTADAWAKSGYAVLQLTARGFGDSCGKLNPSVGVSYDTLACGATGYIRLDDDRYEVRDVQNAVGSLVDAGLVNPQKIGVTGESYGGGVSLQLATLKDRVMNPDGTISPWRSPAGTPLSVAAAAPIIPWSDLAYSLVPNGHTVDTGVVGPTRRRLTAGDREAVVRLRPVRARPGERDLRRTRRRPAGRSDELVHRTELPDVRIRSECGVDPRHDPALPLGLLPARRQVRLRHRGAGPAAHRQRLHRRPVSGR